MKFEKLLCSLGKIDVMDDTQSVTKSFTSNAFILDVAVRDTEDFEMDYLFVVLNNNRIFACNLNNVFDGEISNNFAFIAEMKTMVIDSLFFNKSGKSLLVSTEDLICEISLILKNEPTNADLSDLEATKSVCLFDHMVSYFNN